MAIERRTTKKGEVRYLVRIFRGVNPTGRRLELHRTFPTLKDAKRWETAQKRALDMGTFCEPTNQSLGSYMQEWLAGSAKVRVRTRTWQDYARCVDKEILPAAIAVVPLSRLSTAQLEQFYAELMARGLGPRSVRYVHGLIHAALKKACRDRVLAYNAATEAELPRQIRREMTALTGSQVRTLLAVSASMLYPWDTRREEPPGNRWHALWHLLVNGGLRPSEALAMRWGDVGEDRIVIRHSLVRGIKGESWRLEEPKTTGSRRTVTLPPETITALQNHRLHQEIEKLTAGTRYLDQDFVFATRNGAPADLHNITKRHFLPLLEVAELPRIRIYDLRHTHATLMLSAGVPVKVVSDRLGHASAVMTLNTYAHVLPGQQEDAVVRYLEYMHS